MSVQVNTTTNNVTVQNAHQTITIVDNENANIVNVEQPLVNVIEVATPGPQGQQGPPISGGNENFIPLWSSTGSLTTSSIYEAAPTQIIIGDTQSVHPGYEEALAVYQGTTTSYNLISGHSNVNSYSQLNIKNFSSGPNASSDVVATADNGNEDSNYIDMGINSSGFTNENLVGAAGDAYMYSTGNDLYIGNASAGKRVIIFNGDLDALNNAVMFVHENGTVSINTDNYDNLNPSSLWIEAPNAETYNLIVAKANVNLYSQFALTNQNSGSLASADIVAQNDLGTEEDYYVDMGINSSGHGIDPSYTVGGPNDTYMLSVSTGGDHYIGSPTNGSIIMFTGDDFNGEEHAKLILKANNQHQISGSLSISGSINLNNILTLTPQSPLPSGVATGSFAVSSSVPPKPYFYDGTTWNALY
jgi:hypothetical protein